MYFVRLVAARRLELGPLRFGVLVAVGAAAGGGTKRRTMRRGCCGSLPMLGEGLGEDCARVGAPQVALIPALPASPARRISSEVESMREDREDDNMEARFLFWGSLGLCWLVSSTLLPNFALVALASLPVDWGDLAGAEAGGQGALTGLWPGELRWDEGGGRLAASSGRSCWASPKSMRQKPLGFLKE